MIERRQRMTIANRGILGLYSGSLRDRGGLRLIPVHKRVLQSLKIRSCSN